MGLEQMSASYWINQQPLVLNLPCRASAERLHGVPGGRRLASAVFLTYLAAVLSACSQAWGLPSGFGQSDPLPCPARSAAGSGFTFQRQEPCLAIQHTRGDLHTVRVHRDYAREPQSLLSPQSSLHPDFMMLRIRISTGFTISAEPEPGYGQRHCQPLLQTRSRLPSQQ